MKFSNNQPLYIQIADHLCESVLKGAWRTGERIPSVREYALQIQVNPNTVMRAYNLLQEKGIIANERGIGHFVPDSGPELAYRMIKDEFLNDLLPQVRRKMNLLNISFQELIHRGSETATVKDNHSIRNNGEKSDTDLLQILI